ncbi:toll/interleukin-1 receptor domain-containing protein [Pseudomonas fulva]|uniref:Toll/interleukin-1 receptor domain-containing protein n=1 Tax=Pseudomonas fulva TaxID=47880 RepID=A0A7S9LLK0_9PSED|nr:toll/interleukin-1 receptor domain-containing protein [Pseudomonas fulva]QPH51358.1 toll/interleukin-1 receptor domain-containing protein [Pseudomonas fulva]
MKIFISWSGKRSRLVAELISDWIKCVLQASRPWISTRDIDRGAIWFTEISDQLRDTAVGIVCLTQENKNKPWILFESGALAKGLSTSRVCTFLVDLSPSDVEDPLAQFNHTVPAKDSLWALVRSLNSALEASGLDERILAQVFDTYWPQFQKQFDEALKSSPQEAEVQPRSEESILDEILSNTRALTARVRSLESRGDVGLEAFESVKLDSSGELKIPKLTTLIKEGVPVQELVSICQMNDIDLELLNGLLAKYRPGVKVRSARKFPLTPSAS